ncbi:MAG TPA: hypothetical protein VL443_29500 [Cyclobacteriaceae bacterium]|jgi:hypothetical protein|nr:hypothetical protein [Cyclobacteriaceae bacterium]
MTSQRIGDASVAIPQLDIAMVWEKRIEYDGNNPIYVGWNKEPNASTAKETWYIIKNTFSGSNLTRSQLPDEGALFNYAWDDRATLFS